MKECATLLTFIYILHVITVESRIIEGPSNVTYVPGVTPLPIELTCNVTGITAWRVNGLSYLLSDLTNGKLAGHNRTGKNILVNNPVNNTEYFCLSQVNDDLSIPSDPAYVVISGLPNITNITNKACLKDIVMSWDVISDLTRVSCNLTLSFNGTMMRNGSTEDTRFTFEELAPDNKYTVSIQPTSAAGNGGRYSQTITTAPKFNSTIARVSDKCLTYIAIEIIPINETFCDGAVNYTIAPPSDGQVKVVNQTRRVHNITGLRNNTSYEIITFALRNGIKVLNTTMNEMTLQSLKPPPVDPRNFEFHISSSNSTNQNCSIFLRWTRPDIYGCVPDFNYTIFIFINGSDPMNKTFPGNVTNISIAVEFPPHPMRYNNYTASIIVMNSEGNSSSTNLTGIVVPVYDGHNNKTVGGSDHHYTIIIIVVVVTSGVGVGIAAVGIAVYKKKQKAKRTVPSKDRCDDDYAEARKTDDALQEKDHLHYDYAMNGPRGVVFPSTISGMPQNQ